MKNGGSNTPNTFQSCSSDEQSEEPDRNLQKHLEIICTM